MSLDFLAMALFLLMLGYGLCYITVAYRKEGSNEEMLNREASGWKE